MGCGRVDDEFLTHIIYNCYFFLNLKKKENSELKGRIVDLYQNSSLICFGWLFFTDRLATAPKAQIWRTGKKKKKVDVLPSPSSSSSSSSSSSAVSQSP